MNTKFRNYFTLLVLLLMSIPLLAQEDRTYYDYNKDWTFGIHAGASWQESDVYDRFGGGLGLSLGKRFYGSPGSMFALDWRGRLTYSNSFGQDFQRYALDNTDENLLGLLGDKYENSTYVFNNYRTDMVDLNLEGVITLNKLRERHGVILQLFGGLGLDFYNAKIDQLDDNGDAYNYISIDDTTGNSNSQIRRDINDLRGEFFRDGVYETSDDTRLTLMPSWGFGIGYQPRDWFSFGYEHRFAYPMTDMLDGVGANEPTDKAVNDIHHLSYLYARFHFSMDSDCLPPVIRLTNPTANPLSTQSPSVNVTANIEQVSNTRDIEVTVNDLPVYNHDYNTATDRFNLAVLLQNGENIVRIKAKNKCDQDEAVLRIIFNPSAVGGQAPEVDFSNPVTNNYSTDESSFGLRARVRRVNSKSDITFKINGTATRNFSYDRNDSEVTANIPLIVGANVITITATNQYGTDEDVTTIIRKEVFNQVNAPTVRITTPSANPHTTSNPSQFIVASIENVSRKEDITFTVNNQKTQFRFNTRNGQLESTINLRDGNNVVRVQAVNNGGNDSDQATIIYKRNVVVTPTPTKRPPTVRITSPQNGTTATSNQQRVTATITNISRKSQIIYKVNGRKSSSFSFNANSNRFESTVNLNKGENRVEIFASNNDGRDEDNIVITYKNPALPPVITLITPNQNPAKTNNSRYVIEAKIKNVTSKNEITFRLNGSKNSFSYNAKNNTFSTTVVLKRGTNSFEIKASNRAGRDQADGKIVYETAGIALPPTVKISSPNDNAVFKTPAQVVKATIKNVSSNKQIAFKVNGNSTAFKYDAKTDLFEGKVTLVEGRNKIEIVATNNVGTDQDQIHLSLRTTNNPAPIITITRPTANPATATSNKEVIKAKILNISSKSDITFVINNNANTAFTFNTTTKEFSASVTLKEGPNNFRITATNNSGKDQKSGMIVYKKQNIPAPQITVTTPKQNPFTTTVNKATITATIKNVVSRSGIKFTVNGKQSTRFVYSNGRFSSPVSLKNGSNRYLITATNKGGRDQAKGEIIYKPQIINTPRPDVTISSPSNNSTTKNPMQVVIATIKNVNSKVDVTFKLNGRKINNFTFNPVTGKFSGEVKLKAGRNNVVVAGRNKMGSDQADVNITYQTCQKPAITITQPTANPYTMTNLITIDANVLNVQGSSDIKVTVNGTTTGNWSYKTSNKKLTIDYANWRSGSNILVITATNSCGVATKSLTVNYQKVARPQISFSSPTRNGGAKDVSTKSVIVKANVANVSKSDITFTVNGKSQNFGFTNGVLATTAALKNGANIIKIVARNSGGQDTKQVVINYVKVVVKPSINISSSSSTVRKSSYTLKANVRNMDSKNGVFVLVNGQNKSGFSFSRSGALSLRVTLKEGVNSIQVGARNSAGADMKTISVTYKKPDTPKTRNGDIKNKIKNKVTPRSPKPKTTKKPKTSKPKTTKKPKTSKPKTTKKPKTSKPKTTKKPKTSKPKTTKKPKTSKLKTTKKPKTSKPKTTKKPKTSKPKTVKKPKTGDRKKREEN